MTDTDTDGASIIIPTKQISHQYTSRHYPKDIIISEGIVIKQWECSCGAIIACSNKARHIKSKRHQHAMYFKQQLNN